MFRHAGLDPASRRSSKYWIPAFAGMTILIEGVIYKQTLNRNGARFSSFTFWNYFFLKTVSLFSEAPRPQGGASRQGIIVHIVPLYPAYPPTAGRQGGACGARSGQGYRFALRILPVDIQKKVLYLLCRYNREVFV